MKKTNRILTAVLSIMMILTVICQPVEASAAYKGKTSKKVKIIAAHVSLSKTSVKLTVGKTAALTAKYNGRKVKPAYATSSAAAATVNKSGKITARGAGTAVITAAYKDTKALCKVTVTEAEAKHVTTEAVTKQPACIEDGIRTVTCSCGDTWTETIPAAGRHTWVNEDITSEETTEIAVPGDETNVTYIFPQYATAACQNELRLSANPETDTIIEGASGYACNKCGLFYSKKQYPGAEALEMLAVHSFEPDSDCHYAGYWSPKVCCIKRVITSAHTETVVNTVTKTVTKCTVCGAVKDS